MKKDCAISKIILHDHLNVIRATQACDRYTGSNGPPSCKKLTDPRIFLKMNCLKQRKALHLKFALQGWGVPCFFEKCWKLKHVNMLKCQFFIFGECGGVR